MASLHCSMATWQQLIDILLIRPWKHASKNVEKTCWSSVAYLSRDTGRWTRCYRPPLNTGVDGHVVSVCNSTVKYYTNEIQ